MNLRFHFTIDVDWAPGSESGLVTLLEISRRFRLPTSLFIAGMFAKKHPRLLHNAVCDGHELGTHGWLHCVEEGENFRDCSLDSQRRWIDDATDAVQRATGIRPLMFRAPDLCVSETTHEVLEEAGYRLDSSVPARRLAGHLKYAKYFGAPLEPYYPARDHLGRRGDSPILEVPPSSFGVPLNMSALRTLGFGPVTWATRRVMRRSAALVFYSHPSEFVPASDQYVGPNEPKRYREGLGPQNIAVLQKYIRYILDLGYRPTLLSEHLHEHRAYHSGE